MGALRLLVVAAWLVLGVVGKREVGPDGRSFKPTFAEYFQWSGSPEYLGHGMQVVGVMQPINQRYIDARTGLFNTVSSNRAIQWSARKRNKKGPSPFKVRLVHLDPAGIVLTLKEQGKLDIGMDDDPESDSMLYMRISKPTPWYKKLL